MVKQKKQFHFRHWKMDIGGDICMASTIQLHGKSYTAFINGDAMGKSMQGAGGALVLGVIFRSYITRTKMVALEQKRYPEQWIKECFIELQKVFESFDGTMLISVVMGLIDDDSGLMYYLNAEHPWTVLYRDGKASFIEQELMLRKIGTTGLRGSISIQTFPLQKNDVILAGSDGRDDVVLGENEQGHRVINEDESIFLRKVEEGNGDLDQIESAIKKMGELSDDLSLLRMHFKGVGVQVPLRNFLPESEEFMRYFKQGHNYLIECKGCDKARENLEKAYKIDQDFPMLLKDLTRVYLRQKEYLLAAQFSDKYIEQRPDDLNFIYLASLTHKKNNNLEKAADLGERIRLRNPFIINNLANLADIYRLLGNIERSEMFAAQVLEKDPDNRKALRVLQAVQKDTTARNAQTIVS